MMEIVRNQSEKEVTTRANRVENFTKKKMDNDKEVMSECVHERENVFKFRSRSEVERIDRALHEIRKTCVTISTLVLPSTHEREYLNFIFTSTTRFAISVHIILLEGRKWHILSQLCYRCSAQGLKCWNLRRFTFSNIASYFVYANQLVLIQRWAKSNASCWASSEGNLDKPENKISFKSCQKIMSF